MLRQVNLTNLNETQEYHFGIPICEFEYQQIKKKLDLLKERCPSQCSLNLSFKGNDSSYEGEISVKTASEHFYSRKRNSNLYSCYMLLEEEIDQQLLKWKRSRFNTLINDNKDQIQLSSI